MPTCTVCRCWKARPASEGRWVTRIKDPLNRTGGSWSVFVQSRWPKRLSLAFAIYSLALTVVLVIVLLAKRATVAAAHVGFAEPLLSVLSLSLLGSLLIYHRPENAISWLMVSVAALRQTGYLNLVIEIALAEGRRPTLAMLLGFNAWVWVAGLTYTILAFLFILFPSGRLPSQRWRFAIGLLGLQALLTAALAGFLTSDLIQAFSHAGAAEIVLMPPVERGPLSPTLHVRVVPGLQGLTGLSVAIALAMILLGLWSQVHRFRHGGAVERQQIKWVMVAIALWAGAIMVWLALGAKSFGLLVYVSPILPSAIAIAILRYRLYDIDLILHRTLVYAVLTAVLAAAYLGSVLVLQSLFQVATGERRGAWVTMLSTLASAALFMPVRGRVQAVIDRRFYRQKYDAARMMASFSASIRDETDLNALRRRLLEVVDQAMQPDRVSLWLRAPDEGQRQPRNT